MKKKNLGSSGLHVSVVGLGCINMGMMNDQAQTEAVVNKALDLGINFFDVANTYGGPNGMAEDMLSQALGARRPDIVLATKFGGASGRAGGAMEAGGSRHNIMKAAEASLKALKTDYIDLYQIHFPDHGTPIDETLRALDDLITQGKVRYVGNSNFAAWQLVEAEFIARELGLNRFVSAQNRYSLINRGAEDELVPAAQKYGIGILPYFPLESGLLTGKVKRGEAAPEGSRLSKWSGAFVSDAKFDTIDKLMAVAEPHGRTLLDYAIGWLAHQSHVSSVIAGATKPEQLEQNVAAAEIELSVEELAGIEEALS